MIRNRLKLIIAMIIILNIFPVTAFAAGENRDNPLIDTTDKTNFPSAPDLGSVEINKSAKWIDKSNKYAQIKLDINAVPWPTGTDVVLVLDTSSSMSIHASKCVNPEHYVDFTYTKPFTYQVSVVPGGGSWINVTSDLTISGRAHIGDNNASGLVESYSTSGLLTEYGGQPITYYGAGTSSTFSASDINSQSLATTKRFFCRAFGGDTITIGSKTLTFPLDTYWYTLGTPYHADQNHEYTDSYDIGCFFRIDVAKKAAKAFADIMLGNEGNPSGNRVSMLTFSRTVTLFDSGKFFTGSDTDIAKLKSEIDNITIPADQGTSYGIALNAARDIINSRPGSEKHRPAYVLFVSDGEPEYIEDLGSRADETKEDVKNAIDSLNKVSSGTYTVGIGLTTENELREIKAVVKEPGININVSSEASELQETFEKIAHLTMQQYEKAIITDIIADEFELVPHSKKYPWIVTIDGIETDISNVKSKDNLLTWTLDKMPSSASLTFYIKLKPNTAPGLYDTNKNADIIYVNHLGNWCKQTFPIPQLKVLSSINEVPKTGDNSICSYLVYIMAACVWILIIRIRVSKKTSY